MTTDLPPAEADWPLAGSGPQPLESVPASLLVLAEWTGGRAGRSLRAIAERQLTGDAVDLLDDPVVATLPPRLRHLLKLGRERSTLPTLLAVEIDLAQQRRSRLAGTAAQLAYPALVLLLALVVLQALLLSPVPLSDLADDFGIELPRLVATVWSVYDHPGWITALIALLVAGIVLAVLIAQVPALRPLLDRVPGFGAVSRTLDRAELMRLGGVLVAAGLPPAAALREAAGLAGSTSTRRRAADAAGRIEQGEPVDEALNAAGLADAVLEPNPTAAELGERFDQIGTGLAAVAEIALETLLMLMSLLLYAAAVAVVTLVLLIQLAPVQVFVSLLRALS